MTIVTQYELKKLRKAAGEAVRRDISYDDWMDECVPHLSNRVGDHPDHLDQVFATNVCSMMWNDAVKEDQK